MSKKSGVWMVVAAALVLVGCIIFGSVMTMLGWDFSKLSTVHYETREHPIDEAFTHIAVVTNTADVVFVPSETGTSSVVCYEQKNVTHTVSVKEDTLVIEVVDTRRWYEHIGIHFSAPTVTVYMPQGTYGALSVESDTGAVTIPKAFAFDSVDVAVSTGAVTNGASASGEIAIKTSTGAIRVEDVSVGRMNLSVSTGSVAVLDVDCAGDVTVDVSTGQAELTNVTCENLQSDGDTGDIVLHDVIVADRLSIERSTGGVRFDGCDAASIVVNTDTGSVTGSLLTDKVFAVKTDTGMVDVPRTTDGGRCEIETDTGDIRIRITASHKMI